MHRGVSLAIVLGTAFAASAVIAVPACSLLVDTNGLSRNDDAGSAADVGVSADAPGEATPDATVLDASTPDATSNVDAADSDAGFSCPQGSGIFCDDFDHDALGTRWTSADQGGGSLVFENGGVTPPHALHAEVLGGPNAYANLIERFPEAPAGHVRCELDMELPAKPPAGEVDVLVLKTNRGGATPSFYQLYLQHITTGWALGEYGTIADGGPVDHNGNVADLPIGRWMHLVFETDGSMLSLTVDGTSYGTLALSPAAGATGDSRDIRVGLAYVEQSVAFTSRYDNVLCTYGP